MSRFAGRLRWLVGLWASRVDTAVRRQPHLFAEEAGANARHRGVHESDLGARNSESEGGLTKKGRRKALR